MRGFLNIDLRVPPFTGRFRIEKLLLLILSIGFVLGEVNADNHTTQQIVKVTGTVVDNNTEIPIAEVAIRVVDTKIRVTTDETGTFSLELPSGIYKIHASAPFYNTFVITDFQVNIGMKKWIAHFGGHNLKFVGIRFDRPSETYDRFQLLRGTVLRLQNSVASDIRKGRLWFVPFLFAKT